MAQNESQTNRAEKPSSAYPIGTEFAEMGKKRLEELLGLQTELLEKLHEVNRNWFERVKSEAGLASEFTAKMTSVRSIPESATAFQEWTNRHMEMAAEDAKHLLADTQKFMETGARFLSNGWLPNGRGGTRS